MILSSSLENELGDNHPLVLQIKSPSFKISWTELEEQAELYKDVLSESLISKLDDEVQNHLISGRSKDAFDLALFNLAAAVIIGREVWVSYCAKRLDNLYQPFLADPEVVNEYIFAIEASLKRFSNSHHEEKARLLIGLGNAYIDRPDGSKRTNLDKALSYLISAKDEAHSVTSKCLLLIEALNGLGRANLGYIDARLDTAVETFTQAINIDKNCPDDESDRWMATLLHNRGIAYSRMDRSYKDQAIQDIETALRLRPKNIAPLEHAETLSELGNIYFSTAGGTVEQEKKQLKYAAKKYKEARELFKAADRPIMSRRCSLQLARVLRNMPELHEEDRLKNLFDASKILESELAEIELDEKKDSMFEYVDFNDSLANVYRDISSLFEAPENIRIRSIRMAEERYQKALNFWKSQGDPVMIVRIQNNLGKLWRDAIDGDIKKNQENALKAFRNALDLADEKNLIVWVAKVNQDLAELWFKRQEWPKAKDCYIKALEMLEKDWNNLMGFDELQDLRIKRSTMNRKLGLCYYYLSDMTKAVEAFEAGKTWYLVNLIMQRDTSQFSSKSPLHQQFADLLASDRRLDALLRKEKVTSARSQIMDGKRRIKLELDKVSVELRKQDPDFIATAKPLSFDQIKMLLQEDDSAIVEIRVLSDKAIVFIITKNHPLKENVIALPECGWDNWFRPLVDTWINAYYDLRTKLQQRDPGICEAWNNWHRIMEKTNSEVYSSLFAKLDLKLSEMGIKKICIIHHRALDYLPLHAAFYEKEKKRIYLQDKYEISYAPSALILERCLARKRSSCSSKTLVAVANPLCDLRFSDLEINVIQKLFHKENCIVLRDAEASVRALEEIYQKAGFLHLSCHGSFNINKPTESGLVLAGNELLTLDKIMYDFNLKNNRLVVLSACESALSDLQDTTDEYIGLPAAFLVAGTTAVVGSLWLVDDLATSLLIEQFYMNYLNGHMTPAAALREAQLWLRSLSQEEVKKQLDKTSIENAISNYASIGESEKPFGDPYYWAAFITIGV
ncbi:MAG: CHAT domain-containing protein [Methanotrichaceae archaeon]